MNEFGKQVRESGPIGIALPMLRARDESMRAEVSLLRAERDELARQLEAYKRAKAENDERFMLERDAAESEVRRLRAALTSIADNTCCDGCQQAAKWARAALDGKS
jgi:hypothetical protein